MIQPCATPVNAFLKTAEKQVPVSLQPNKINSRLIYRFVIMILMMCCCFTYLFAAGYDFNKLVSLAKQKYGDEAANDFSHLQKLTAQLKSAPELEKLKQINDFFNQRIMFGNDIDIWGQSDYWASPLESIGLQAGDCEDFSIAKYVFLKAVDVPNDKLRLTYVKAVLGNQGSAQAHMILSYYATPSSEPLILDNLKPEILPASSRKDLSPVFSFNDKGLWVGGGNNPKGDAQTSLSRWRDVIHRMQLEGIE